MICFRFSNARSIRFMPVFIVSTFVFVTTYADVSSLIPVTLYYRPILFSFKSVIFVSNISIRSYLVVHEINALIIPNRSHQSVSLLGVIVS
jgi:hypothetical protein